MIVIVRAAKTLSYQDEEKGTVPYKSQGLFIPGTYTALSPLSFF
jgi:hypothetical protein